MCSSRLGWSHCVRKVGCGDVDLTFVYGWLTTLKVITLARSFQPITQSGKHRNHCLVMGINHCCKWDSMGYTMKTSYLWLGEMSPRDGKPANNWHIEQSECQVVSSRIWNASPQSQFTNWHSSYHQSQNVQAHDWLGNVLPLTKLQHWHIELTLANNVSISQFYLNEQWI